MKFALAALLAFSVGALVTGCDSSKNESYTGVPKDGRACEEAYVKPANVAACVRAESQH